MTTTVHALPIPPIVKTVIVACEPAAAFHVFTAEIGRWYPLDRYSIAPAIDCQLEPHVGGRLYEIGIDGQERLWGHVLEWNPPSGLALSWQARVSEDEAQRVDVSFRAVQGGTEVQLVHAGWERVKVGAREWRDKYEGGWVEVFERCFKGFADKAG